MSKKQKETLETTKELLKDVSDIFEKSSAKEITDINEAVSSFIKLFRNSGFEVKVFRHKWKLAKRLDISSNRHVIPINGGEVRPTISLIVRALPNSKHLIFKLK